MEKKPTKDDLDIDKDRYFLENLLKYFGMNMEIEPGTQLFLLDLSYSKLLITL